MAETTIEEQISIGIQDGFSTALKSMQTQLAAILSPLGQVSVKLDDISKEGLSLKQIFSEISENFDKITMNASINQKENNRKLDENLETLENQLFLIKALMEQIAVNLELVNQNKELLYNNIQLSNELNQQKINNSLLTIENQKLLEEKVNK